MISGVRCCVAVALALAVGSGCIVRRGAQWTSAPEAAEPTAERQRPPPAGVSLVLVGNAGAPGRGAAKVAARLDRVLVQAHAEAAEPIVLWLGNNVMPDLPDVGEPDCVDAAAAWARPGTTQLAEAVRAHIARGHASYAVLGELDWRCALADGELQREYADGPHPWRMPAVHYVVRVTADGGSQVVSACTADGCTIEPASAADAPEAFGQPLVDLVLVDATAWIHRDALPAGRAEDNVDSLSALLMALGSTPPEAAPPRILVSHFPVEAAGYHGQGGGDPDATWHFLPPALQHAIKSGMFAGVLAAHDRGLYADDDISNAVKRSDKTWIDEPLFQVVSGGASVREAGYRRLRHFTSIALLPDLYTPDHGFAVVRIDGETVSTTLHTRHIGRWQTADLTVPLRRPPFPPSTPSPPMQPCLRCPEVPANERP